MLPADVNLLAVVRRFVSELDLRAGTRGPDGRTGGEPREDHLQFGLQRAVVPESPQLQSAPNGQNYGDS